MKGWSRMADLSLRQYQHEKGVVPNNGVRCCAPELKTISLRKLLIGINRKIIHLSDLHIGLNCKDSRKIPEKQVQTIITSIINSYPKESNDPMPIVVITGDVVDHGSHSSNSGENHVETMATLLQQLVDAGFSVLVVPGNHDYSDAFDSTTLSPLESGPLGPSLASLVAIVAYFKGKGLDPHLVSGITFSNTALNNFQKLNPFLKNGMFINFQGLKTFSKYGLIPEYNGRFLESWKDKGAVYDLDFILLDGQDLKTKTPLWDVPPPIPTPIGPLPPPPDAPLPLDQKFFLNDGNFRVDKGWLDDTGCNFFRECVDYDTANKTLPIVAIHYWMNYSDRTGDSKLVNDKDLFDILDQCRLILVGHRHYRPENDNNDPNNPKNNSNWQPNSWPGKAFYCEVGSTCVDPIYWDNEDLKKSRRTWVELNVNLRTGEVSALPRMA